MNETAEAIRGTLTILFTDLEGSTDLRVREGDTVANEVIHTHDELIRAQLELAGGVEATRSLGDGFMGLFTSANQAIHAAVSIQKAIEEHNEAHPGIPISVRMGINSGDVTQLEGDARGTAVNAAARVAAKAHGGQILVSQIVNDLAGTLSDSRIVDRGLFWLKGFPDRWRLYEVLWRDRDAQTDRTPKDMRAASAAAFDLDMPRATGPIVGRDREQKMLKEQFEISASLGLRAVVLEGEAGIGKTKLLQRTAELAASLEKPYWVLDVGADEELRGPFLLFRSLLTAPLMTAVARQAMALEPLDRAQEAISGRGARDEGLSPQEQMLRTFDDVATVFSALTRERPLALLLDDLQWADEDSIQLIRYLVRTLASAPILLVISIRPLYDGTSGGIGKLIADLDRLRVTQILKLPRLSRVQTGELLENLLGAPIEDSTLKSIHARSEGVPFFIEELARAYREAEALQLMDGTWTMTRLSGPAIPSSIQSLIERRLAQLSEDCRSLLGDAGVLGRRFKLNDLSRVIAQIEEEPAVPAWKLGESLQSAVDFGLLVEEPDGSLYDLSFSHDQIRASLLGSRSKQRQRAIHGAIAETLAAEGGTENLSMLAYHSLKSGDQERAVSSGIEAARAAMNASANEEGLRIIDATLAAASKPEDRIEMLRLRDDALAVLDRGMERIANLAEMTALTGAIPSPALEAEVKLRRASAARANEDFDLAVEIARGLRLTADETSDKQLELAACLELGQALTASPLGESYVALVEVDFDQAQEAFERVLEIAVETGARADEAAALRELAVLEIGRAKLVAIEAVEAGTGRIEILMQGPTLFAAAKDLAEKSFHIYEELGDKRGSMSALITMAYTHITDPTPSGMAGRLEHIRALHHARKSDVTDSQRANDEAQMLYGIQTFARVNFQLDLAVERGQQAYEAARSLGNRWLECLAAGGLASTYAAFGATDQCGAWLDRAASAAMSAPNTSLARRLEMWRADHAYSSGEVEKMIGHYERAVELAGQKNLAGQWEALSTMAIRCARFAIERDDASLRDRAKTAAIETLKSIRPVAGHTPWESVAHAALAVVAEAEGDPATAADEARIALEIDGDSAIGEYIWVLWAAAQTLIAHEEPETPALKGTIAGGVGYLGMSISDPEIRAKWLDTPTIRDVAQIVGFDLTQSMQPGEADASTLTDEDIDVLRDMAMGSVASQADGANSEDVDKLFAKIGVGSEVEAIEYAIKAGVTWR